MSRIGWVAAAVYVTFAVGFAGYHKPLSTLRFGTPQHTYGYLVAWVAESLSFDEEDILRSAIEAARERSDRLSPRETPLDFGSRIAICPGPFFSSLERGPAGSDVAQASVDDAITE